MFKILIILLIFTGENFLEIKAVPLAGTDPGYLQEMESSMAKILREYVEIETSKLDILAK